MSEKVFDESKVVLRFGGKPEESTIALRFFGDELIPTEISKKLQCQPTDSYQKGKKLNGRIARTGTWLLNNTIDNKKNTEQTLEEQILELFEKLPKELEIWQDLTTRFEGNIFCAVWLKGWNRGFWLNSKVLQQIAERGLEIRITIYCECDDEEETVEK